MGFTEDNISQLPVLKLLINLGYQYLESSQALALRDNRESSVILTNVLRERLTHINEIKIGSKKTKFDPSNIEKAIQKLQDIQLSQGLIQACNQTYNLLLFGLALEQSIEGDKKSHTIQYIDWNNPANNHFHVTEEFTVLRTGRKDTYRPDVVLFVNGIPLVVIECKSPTIKEPVKQAISQHIRNQQENGIRNLYVYSQVLIATSLLEAKYATTNTKEEFWAVWKEKEASYLDNIEELVNRSLEKETVSLLFKNSDSRTHADKVAFNEKFRDHVSVTEQDIVVYGILNPERLLPFIKDFVLFEGGLIKKVARFQQFFSINKIIDRIKPIRNGKRKGGVVWHTQGSGKSLTMAMLARKIQNTIKNPQIILVTDRIDLDRQITNTLRKVEVDVINAASGKQLISLLKGNGDLVITTIINKFEAAVKSLSDNQLDSPNIFVLIDEGHRTQHGVFNVNMERVLPNACFIVFTGTPLMKKQKNTASKFGGIIDEYSIKEAVDDGAIRPILYEGRLAVQDVNKSALDKSVDIVMEELPDYHKVDLKKKMSQAGLITKTDQNIFQTALDISKHFQSTWGKDATGIHSGFRGMVVCPDKLTAVKYKKAFDLIGKVTTEVVMSAPDTRENNEDVHSSEAPEVKQYYDLLKSKYGNEIDNMIIQQFEYGENIELLIVIDKLLTGFDVPQTIVMYLCRKLREHTLLQAIARVNRVYPGKDFGYIIDYAGVMEELHEAIETYSGATDSFDTTDLQGTMTDIQEEISKLPQAYADLVAIFKTVKNKQDIEAYIRVLADEAIREEFYNKFNAFARILKIALATVYFHDNTSLSEIQRHKDELKKYADIRVAANATYLDTISFSQYEKQLQKLLDQHVITEEIIRLVDPVNILDGDTFEEEVEKLIGPRAKAEKIAAATSKYISINIDTDPVLFKKLSELITATISDMRANRLSELEALKKLKALKDQVLNGNGNNIPEELQDKRRKVAIYHLFQNEKDLQGKNLETTLVFDKLLSNYEVVDWEKRSDIINKIELDFGDYLMDEMHLSLEQADELTKKAIEIAIANKG
ncbi:HsdR family type I site-specific deoxyribonuclease [Flavobacterium sp. LHD-85]|uniref:type I restriction endonuclease subunit R n=1 Tax=Flavobacterium sp. LHD-85 TaxID=3071410 RepID=UPI0027E1DA95|nr:HsdR family type I site-specific deoxyribonuclease [Flavobacterium sp. LHD-85]MDQ6528938.1 HsdR family type I site-specific deoxyribonuclease [Flavobacterium sp. LHD-85]